MCEGQRLGKSCRSFVGGRVRGDVALVAEASWSRRFKGIASGKRGKIDESSVSIGGLRSRRPSPNSRQAVSRFPPPRPELCRAELFCADGEMRPKKQGGDGGASADNLAAAYVDPAMGFATVASAGPADGSMVSMSVNRKGASGTSLTSTARCDYTRSRGHCCSYHGSEQLRFPKRGRLSPNSMTSGYG